MRPLKVDFLNVDVIDGEVKVTFNKQKFLKLNDRLCSPCLTLEVHYVAPHI